VEALGRQGKELGSLKGCLYKLVPTTSNAEWCLYLSGTGCE
jgi:hypothetical protein